MGDNKTDGNGKLLLLYLLNSSLINIHVGPTRFSANSATAPDRILLSPAIANKILQKEVKKSLPSDHGEIYLSLNIKLNKKYNVIERSNFRKTDWDRYKENLNKSLQAIHLPITNSQAIEITNNRLATIINNELNLTVPKEKIILNTERLPFHIIQLIRLKRKYVKSTISAIQIFSKMKLTYYKRILNGKFVPIGRK